MNEFAFDSIEEDEEEVVPELKFTALEELAPMSDEEQLLEQQMELLEKTQTKIRYYLNEIKNNLH